MTAAAEPESVPEEFNLASHLVDRWVEQGRGDAVALWWQGRPISYAQVQAGVAAAARGLAGRGVRVEERVLLALPDRPELVYLLLAVLRLGAVAVPVSPVPGAVDLAHVLADSRATVAAVEAGLLPALAEVPEQRRPHLRLVVPVAGPDGAGPGGAGPDGAGPDGAGADGAGLSGVELVPYEELVAGDGPVPAAERTSRDDVAFWLYSSGTTGRPKAVVHLHQAPVHAWRGFAEGVLGLRAEDRVLSVAPMASSSGLCNSCFFPFAVGAAGVLLAGERSPAAVTAALTAAPAEARPTVLFARPVNYRALLEQAGGDTALRVAVCSGDRLPADVATAFRDRYGLDVLEGVGSTEALHIYLAHRPGRSPAGSSGEPVPGYEARLVDEDGRPVPTGQVGDLLLRGGSVFAAYWHRRDTTRAALLGDWLVTGDKYRQDEDGYYWYVGRSDDLWFAGGGWVSPAEIEERLAAHPAVREAGVTGVPGEGGTEPLARVVLEPSATAGDALAEELRRWVADELGAAYGPGRVDFAAELPRTASGKVQRYRLRD